MIYVRDDLKPLFASERSVADFLKIDGEIFRESASRRTLKFKRGEREFFIKAHRGFGWNEILRKLVSLHVPAVSALNELCAIQALESLRIDTMKVAAYGEEGISPAAKRSFIVTEALTATESLEQWAPRFVRSKHTRENVRLKRALIDKVAQIARGLHANGLNHQDFYICHFLLDVSAGPVPLPENIKLHLIDLHRMRVRKRTPQRWVVKDIAGVFFSSMDLDLTATDMFRFMQRYTGKRLRDTLYTDRVFWRKVLARAIRVYKEQHGMEPKLPRLVVPT
jgi:hypothetical protein